MKHYRSEIDHTIRYPYDQDNPVFGQFLLILNRLAGSADEMGAFIQFLKKELQNRENNYKQALTEKDKLINQLEQKVKDLKLKEPDLKFLTEGLEKLKLPILTIDNLKLPDFSFLDTIKPMELPKFLTLEQPTNPLVDLSFINTVKPIELPKVKTVLPKSPSKKKK